MSIQKNHTSAAIIIGILAVPFIIIGILLLIFWFSYVTPLFHDNSPRTTEDILISEIHWGGGYVRYNQLIHGMIAAKDTGSLQKIEIMSRDESLAPLYTYRLTYKSDRQEHIFVEAIRVNESFKEADFVLYEADAVQLADGAYKLSQGKAALTGRDKADYRWNGIELEVNRAFFNKYQHQPRQGFVLEINEKRIYYFDYLLDSFPEQNRPLLFFKGSENSVEQDQNANAEAQYIVIYSTHPGLKRLTSDKQLIFDQE